MNPGKALISGGGMKKLKDQDFGVKQRSKPCLPPPPLPSAAPVGPGPAPGNCLADQNCHPHFIILGPGKLLFMTVNLKMK